MDQEKAENAIYDLLVACLGRELTPGETLADTPHRAAKAWGEILSGYAQDPAEVLKVTSGEIGFNDVTENGKLDGMIGMARIPFTSTCEHHMLPFSGTADIFYIPGEKGIVIGASKFARLLFTFTRRFQLQERIGQQVADALEKTINPKGVGVIIRATHTCMACRGVRTQAVMVSSVLRGAFRDPAVRAEFLALIQHVDSPTSV